jgi:hypothetical protein
MIRSHRSAFIPLRRPRDKFRLLTYPMSSPRSMRRMLKWLFAAVAVTTLVLLVWGSDLLIAVDPMPGHADAVVVLQGSIVAEKSRIAGAMNVLQRGIADRALLSVPKESYWGQSIPPVARAYVEHTYGSQLAARVDFCEDSADVNSTADEAEAAMGCVREHHWKSILIVTSDYHTRRARMLWRRAVKRHGLTETISVEGVADPEFQRSWWRRRQAAKIWLGESLKLAWTALGG